MAMSVVFDEKPQLEPDDFFTNAVCSTYSHLLKTTKLDSTQPGLILMQSIQGRAMNGDWANGIRRSRPYPNTTLEEVFMGLGYDVDDIHYQRQEIINGIVEYARRIIRFLANEKNGNVDLSLNVSNTQTEGGEPLATANLMMGTIVRNPIRILQGMYIGGLMDSEDWRSRTEEAYGISMHKGNCVPVNLQALRKAGLTLNDLASLGGSESWNLEKLVSQGIVSQKTEKFRNGFVSGYVESKRGYGISDDAALLATGLMFGMEGAFGLYFADAIDTWDKSAPKIVYGGQDEALAREIKVEYEKKVERPFPVTEEQVMQVIYTASIDQERRSLFPSCSQRRFLQIDDITRMSALRSHIFWLGKVKEGADMDTPSMKIAFQQVWNHDFYRAFKSRYNELVETGKIDRPFELPNGHIE